MEHVSPQLGGMSRMASKKLEDLGQFIYKLTTLQTHASALRQEAKRLNAQIQNSVVA